MTDDIKLPELPRPDADWWEYAWSGEAVKEFARAAVLADRERLKKDRDELRAYAERYRWLRDNFDMDGLCAVRIERWNYGEAMLDVLEGQELDEAIDAARAAGGEV